MQRIRVSRIVTGILLLAVVMLGGQFHPAPGVLAQDGDQCAALADSALSQAQQACKDVARGEICYGNVGVSATVNGDASSAFAASGDTIGLADVDSLATTAANPEAGEWGVAMLRLPAGLPEGAQAVTAVLFGDAQIARPTQAASDSPTMTIANAGSAEVNLRNGAGVNYAVVGTLAGNESAIADGRNEQGDWVRIQYDGGAAWVFTRLITWEGDLNALKVLLPNDITPAFQAGAPFESFTLVTGSAGAALCGLAPSGLLLQYSGDQPATLQVNGTTLEFSDATLLLRATPNNQLDVMALGGSSTVTARGIPETVEAGSAARVTLGGDDGLSPAAVPAVSGAYAFADAASAPISLLPGAMPCMVGVPASSTRVVLRVGPGQNRGALAEMDPNRGYSVIGWANDPEGAPWWQLDTGATKSWVAKADVSLTGACGTVAEAEVPPLVFAPPPAPPADDGAAISPMGDDLAPAANSVWQMNPGSDNMSGECSGAPAINFCDHLAAISPAQGGIMWKGMEASPYYLQRIQPNVYAYSGPNVLGTGIINMTLRFTSDGTLSMTQSLTLSSEPNCQHVYYYSGTRNW